MNPFYNTIIILIIGAGLTFVLGRLSTKINKKDDDNQDKENRIIELEQKLAVLSAEAAPIHAAFLAMSIAKLTHFHTPVADEILQKIVFPFNQTEEEIEELRIILEERMADPSIEINGAEKIHAKILPDLIRLAHLEAIEKEEEKAKTQTIMVEQPTPEKPPEMTD